MKKTIVTEKRRPIVVGIGELLWDLLPTGKKAGGAPINFVYHASCLGAEGYAVSAIGDDSLGKEIIGLTGVAHNICQSFLFKED